MTEFAPKRTAEEYDALLKSLDAPAPTRGRAAPVVDPNDALTAPPEEEMSWYERAMEFVTGSKESERLQQEYGPQVTEGAPAGLRMNVGAVTGDRDKTINAMNLLGALSGTEFKLDPKTRRLLYKKPGQKGFTMFDPPGMESGDWAEVLGSDTATMVGEGVGVALTKGKAKSGGNKLLRAFWGIFGGAAAGEAAKEAANIQRGAYDHLRNPETGELPTNELLDKLLAEPGKAGSLALVGAGATRLAAGTGKTIVNAARGKWIPKRFVEKGLQLPESLPEAVTDINRYLREAGSDKQFSPDPARLMNDPELMAVLKRFEIEKGWEGHKAVRDLYEANIKALDETSDRMATEALTGAPGMRDVAGSAAALEAETALSRELSGQAEAVGQQALQATGQVEQRAVREPAAPETGQLIKSVPEAEVDSLRKWADRTYGPIYAKAQGKRFYHTNLYNEAEKQSIKYNEDIARTLTQENRRLVDDILGNLNEIRTRPQGPYTSSFEQTQRLISQLKTAEREIDKGMLPGLDKNALASLRKAAMADRERHLKEFDAANKTNLYKEVTEADKIYRQQKDKHAGGVLKDLLKFNPGTRRAVIADERAFSRIFGPDTAGGAERAADFGRVLRDSGGKYLDQYQAIKEAIYKDFLDKSTVRKVTDEGVEEGVVDANRAAKWLADRKQSLQAYLSPDELRHLEKAKDAASLLKSVETKQKLFNRAWSNVDNLMEAKKTLAPRYPDEWGMFKEKIMEQLRSQMKEVDDLLGENVLSYGKLKGLLSGESRNKIRLLFGDEYVKNLDQLRAAAAILGRNPGQLTVDSSNKFVEVLRNVVFGPLSHRNFAFKSVNKYLQLRRMKQLEEIIMDPELLNSAARAMHTSEGIKAFQSLLGSEAAHMAAGEDMQKPFATDKSIQKLQQDIRRQPQLLQKLREIQNSLRR